MQRPATCVAVALEQGAACRIPSAPLACGAWQLNLEAREGPGCYQPMMVEAATHFHVTIWWLT
jgi:hypothetical protein